MNGIAALLCLVLASVPVAAQAPDVLSIGIHGLRSDSGFVRLALFSGADGFPDDPGRALRIAVVAIRDGRATAEFRGLRPGAYAIGMIHDENGNGLLDSGLFRIPLEGYGASNDARSRFGPPRFDDAEFRYEGGYLALTIEAAY